MQYITTEIQNGHYLAILNRRPTLKGFVKTTEKFSRNPLHGRTDKQTDRHRRKQSVAIVAATLVCNEPIATTLAATVAAIGCIDDRRLQRRCATFSPGKK